MAMEHQGICVNVFDEVLDFVLFLKAKDKNHVARVANEKLSFRSKIQRKFMSMR